MNLCENRQQATQILNKQKTINGEDRRPTTDSNIENYKQTQRENIY